MVFLQLNFFSVLTILTISSRLQFSSIASAAKAFLASSAHGLQQIRAKVLQIGTHSKRSKLLQTIKKYDHYCKLWLVGYLIVHILYWSMKGHKKKILVPWSPEGRSMIIPACCLGFYILDKNSQSHIFSSLYLLKTSPSPAALPSSLHAGKEPVEQLENKWKFQLGFQLETSCWTLALFNPIPVWQRFIIFRISKCPGVNRYCLLTAISCNDFEIL
jgi:hypothetical protein